ncbi:MAG: phosphatase PAP2 family protein [Bacilli bacterium]|nr:phosphatase PAP2 family protein [Bacilli bacterium]
MNAFEIKIINDIREAITPFFDKLLELITILGEQSILIVLLLGIYFIYSKKEGQKIAFSIFTSLLLNNAIKIAVQRVRPFEHPDHTFDASRMETATGYSFPSGHTQNAAVSYTSLALSFKKKWLWVVVIILITLIGFSRVGLGVHYPTDVIVGAALGIGCAFLGRYLFEKCQDSFSKQLLLYGITVLIFLPFVFIFLKKAQANPAKFRDFYNSFAFFIGYIGAVSLEQKFVNFDCEGCIKRRIIRFLIALVIAALIQFGIAALLPKTIVFSMLRYFLLSFVTLGLFPLMTKKYLFK